VTSARCRERTLQDNRYTLELITMLPVEITRDYRLLVSAKMRLAIGRRTKLAVVSLVSASRIVVAAAFLYCALDPDLRVQRASLWLLLFLFASDFLDGILARHWAVTTRFGFVLDGLGDRALYFACLLVMSARLGVPFLVTYLLIMRDVILYAARSFEPKWSTCHDKTRWMAKVHAGLLRIMILIYFFFFYARLFAYLSDSSGLVLIKETVLVLSVVASYVSLFFALRAYYYLGKQLACET
jgi:phosphatidylglycerophosphate synthase